MSYLIWDFDNTLAYRPGLWSQCLADVTNSVLPDTRLTRAQFAPHLSSGFPWHTPEIVHHHLSHPGAWWENLYPVLATAVMAVARVNPTSALEIATRFRAHYLDPSQWVVFPDVEPSLAALASHGWRHVILSNHVPELPQLLGGLGIVHHFEQVITSATIGHEKPHPLAFRAAIDAIPPNNRIVMIGDSYTADFKGARAVGLDAILVRGSHPDCDKSSPDLSALVDNLIAA